MTIKKVSTLLGILLLFAPAGVSYGQSGAGDGAGIRYVEPRAEAGLSMATVVGDVPLAHTTQMLPLDPDGHLVGAGDVDAQIDRVLENLRLALAEAGTDLRSVAKLNVYAAREDVVGRVKKRLAEAFAETGKPAVSFVVGQLPHPKALVAMDAVAVAPQADHSLARYHADALYGAPERGHVAVMPPGGTVYISGQVAEGTLLDATRGTMESLRATLQYLELSLDDVVQVKAFMNPIAEAAAVEQEITAFFPQKPAPPVVAVEWHDGSYLSYLAPEDSEAPLPIEIELIAARHNSTGDQASGEALRYSTPPGLTAPATYSRVAEVLRGDLVYVSGLYGDPAKEAEGQMRDIYEALDTLLEKAGSDVDHLAKGTYYVTGKEASERLNSIRLERYDPKRAPASAKMPVRGVGKNGAVVTLDMIGVAVK